MSLGQPATLLLLPCAALVYWFLLGRRGTATALPGAWNKAVSAPMRSYLANDVAISRGQPRWLLAALWVLLVLILANPGLDAATPMTYSNLAGRVVVIDLSGSADIHAQRAVVSRMIGSTPTLPTAIVVATDDAFDAVPLTSDAAYLQRYLQVIAPDVMPLMGRSLPLAFAHAESVLRNAEIAAGQVVLVTAGEPPAADSRSASRWLRSVVVPDAQRAQWERYASGMQATLASDADLGRVTDALEDAVKQLRRSDRRATLDLRPWLTAAAALLWLGLMRRRQQT